MRLSGKETTHEAAPADATAAVGPHRSRRYA